MATAAYFSRNGHSVTLCDTVDQSKEDFDAIRNQGGIITDGAYSGGEPAVVDCLSNDFMTSVRDADLLLICVSAGRHGEIVEALTPAINDGQAVLFMPGNMGAYLLQKSLKAAGKNNVIVAETSGSLWACRRRIPGQVFIALPAKAKTIAAYPTCDTPKAVEAFSAVMEVAAGENVMEATLNSPNVVSHVGGSILNAVQIEKMGDEFALFEHGLSEVYIKCMNGLEAERTAVVQGIGLKVYGPGDEGLFRTLMGDTPAPLMGFRSLEGPSSLAHRYVSEDANCGVALLVSLGKAYGIPTPLSECFLQIASHINDTDYLAVGYTLENLGLDGLTLEGLKAAL